MRIIDADEFIGKLEELYQYAGWDKRDVHFSLADTICNLDMIPTVDAIPIDFIMSEIYVEESVAERTYASFFWRELIEMWKSAKKNWE